MTLGELFSEAQRLNLTAADLVPGMRERLARIQEAKNKVCIGGHLDAALRGVMNSSSADETLVYLTRLAHTAVEVAFLELGAPDRVEEGPAMSGATGLDADCERALKELEDCLLRLAREKRMLGTKGVHDKWSGAAEAYKAAASKVRRVTIGLEKRGHGPRTVAMPPTELDAYDMGVTGAPASEAERLLFEAYMRGHCWKVSGEWDGQTYVGPTESTEGLDPRVAQTRMLWAVWRDRSALVCKIGSSVRDNAACGSSVSDNAQVRCGRAPDGWSCSRTPGHDGPCAARPISRSAQKRVAAQRGEAS